MFAAIFNRALVSGTVAAIAVTLVASLAARRSGGSAAGALNATSHVVWGERAARESAYSMKYTATGFATNYGASLFWASLHEALAIGKQRSALRALLDGALVATVAYVTDYHLAPRRLTPGFEMRISASALALVYAALALGLSGRELVKR